MAGIIISISGLQAESLMSCDVGPYFLMQTLVAYCQVALSKRSACVGAIKFCQVRMHRDLRRPQETTWKSPFLEAVHGAYQDVSSADVADS